MGAMGREDEVGCGRAWFSQVGRGGRQPECGLWFKCSVNCNGGEKKTRIHTVVELGPVSQCELMVARDEDRKSEKAHTHTEGMQNGHRYMCVHTPMCT